MEQPIQRRTIIRLFAGCLAGAAATSGATATRAASKIRMLSHSLPDHIDPETSFGVAATVANDTSEAVNVGVGYYFKNGEIEQTHIEIAAGGQVDVEFEITPSELQEFFGTSIEAGEYSQGIGVFEGDTFHDYVENIVTYGDGSDGTTPAPPDESSTEADGRSGQTADGRTSEQTPALPSATSTSMPDRRGFFSNSNAGAEPAYLSDTFNLTVFGFLLSALGLVHQMIRGN